LERNLTQNETTLSFDAGYAFSFQGGDFWESLFLHGATSVNPVKPPRMARCIGPFGRGDR
jgi:hypothetical protein